MHYYLNHKLGFGFFLVLLTIPGVQYMLFVFLMQIILNTTIFLTEDIKALFYLCRSFPCSIPST